MYSWEKQEAWSFHEPNKRLYRLAGSETQERTRINLHEVECAVCVLGYLPISECVCVPVHVCVLLCSPLVYVCEHPCMCSYTCVCACVWTHAHVCVSEHARLWCAHVYTCLCCIPMCVPVCTLVCMASSVFLFLICVPMCILCVFPCVYVCPCVWGWTQYVSLCGVRAHVLVCVWFYS